MSDQDTDLETRVNDVLERVRSEVESSERTDEATIPALHEDGAQLQNLAAEANHVIEGSEPEDLLSAFDLYRLPGGDEAKSIPEAIARGDPDKVADLRTMVKLSKLSGRWDDQYRDSLESAMDDLRTTIDRRSGDDATLESADDAESKSDPAAEADTETEPDSESKPESESGSASESDTDSPSESASDEDTAEEEPSDDSDGVSGTIRSAAEDVSDKARDVGEEASKTAGDALDGEDDESSPDEDVDGEDDTEAAGSAEDNEGESEDDGGLQDAFQSAIEESLGDFGDDVREAKDHFEAIVEESDSDTDSETDESTDGSDGDTDESDESTDESDDEGSMTRPGRQTTRYSTMASSPSDRPDMNLRSHHSTVPSRDDRSLGGR